MNYEFIESLFYNLFRKYTNDRDFIYSKWEELSKAYGRSKRHYHNLDHLMHMFGQLSSIEDAIEDLDCIYFSIFYHDIIYNVRKKIMNIKVH